MADITDAPADVPPENDGNAAEAPADNNVESYEPQPVQTTTTRTETVEDHTPWVTGRRTDPNAYLEIYELNKDLIGPNKNRLLPGWVLKMPPTPDAPNGGTYTVVYGDTLTWIAQGRGKGTYTQTKEITVEEPAPEPTPAPPTDDAAATVMKAKEQATIQARYKQQGNTDWRVRLSLSPNSDYLYNARPAGILAPLAATDGVIFPYTPSISTTYTANYDQYELIHSNYRGVFYKNSKVGDLQVRGTFSAQDTTEANYLLAVIHFFRSVTKMFYGQDNERGTPPPLVYLNGYGDYQFSDHPCLVTSFNYTLPNDVDYIRATNPNNYGVNLLNRRAAINSSNSNLSGAYRLLNALLPNKSLPETPDEGTVPGSVDNTVRATYVPTKMEIDITLIPVQTRYQVSKQFSLKKFANGQLLKGGYW